MEAHEAKKYPEPTVGALVLNPEGKLLLVRSYKWFGKLTIPGGHIEVGETAQEALLREVREEVGLEVSGAELLIVQEAIFSPEFWKRRHFIFLDYVCRCEDDAVTVDGDEVQGVRLGRAQGGAGDGHRLLRQEVGGNPSQKGERIAGCLSRTEGDSGFLLWPFAFA